MKVLVTGATGFVGRWLMRELTAAGHEAIGTRGHTDPDMTDREAVAALVDAVRPQAIAHLAGMAFGPDARLDPDRAFAVNEAGTRWVLEAVSRTIGPIPVLVVSSSEVYGRPAPDDLPLAETAPLAADQPYGRSKLAQEGVALEYAASSGIPVVIARPFNHTGPGQRSEFVVPAFAARIIAAAAAGDYRIRAGNVDVRRDFSDVRDVVRAYRLLLEAKANSRLSAGPNVYNIASGQAVAIRTLVEMLARLAAIDAEIEVDLSLVRPDDPAEIRGDASRLSIDTGWRPSTPIETTLRDVLDDVRARVGAGEILRG